MARYVLFRLVQLLPVLLLASVATWLMIHLIPGDPAIALLGPEVTPEQLARARALMGLDRPLPVQYALWLGRVVRGDLGVSYLNGLPVSTMLAQRIPVTLQLTLASLVVALAIAAPFRIVSAVRPRSWIARWVTGYNAHAMAVPTFYRSVGLEPRDAKIVAVKSPLQFRDGYGAIALACWVVDTPGPSTARLERLDWRHRSGPLFPFDDDFEPEIRAVLGSSRGGSETHR